MGILGGVFSVIGSAISGFFGFKKAQGKIVEAAVEVAGKVNDADAEDAKARGLIISTEANSDSWLAKNWRPLTMVIFVGLVVARWFGYMPANMTETEILEVYGLVKLGLGGYIGGRSLEKIVKSLGLGSVLKEYIKKKLI